MSARFPRAATASWTKGLRTQTMEVAAGQQLLRQARARFADVMGPRGEPNDASCFHVKFAPSERAKSTWRDSVAAARAQAASTEDRDTWRGEYTNDFKDLEWDLCASVPRDADCMRGAEGPWRGFTPEPPCVVTVLRLSGDPSARAGAGNDESHGGAGGGGGERMWLVGEVYSAPSLDPTAGSAGDGAGGDGGSGGTTGAGAQPQTKKRAAAVSKLLQVERNLRVLLLQDAGEGGVVDLGEAAVRRVATAAFIGPKEGFQQHALAAFLRRHEHALPCLAALVRVGRVVILHISNGECLRLATTAIVELHDNLRGVMTHVEELSTRTAGESEGLRGEIAALHARVDAALGEVLAQVDAIAAAVHALEERDEALEREVHALGERVREREARRDHIVLTGEARRDGMVREALERMERKARERAARQEREVRRAVLGIALVVGMMGVGVGAAVGWLLSQWLAEKRKDSNAKAGAGAGAGKR